MADSSLVATVTNGEIASSTTSTTSSSSSSSTELGKEEFLQLLVTQMKYQDPLEPTSNTEFVSQLATFSSLEQMQNMNQTTINSQAFSLIGKDVIIQTTTSTGSTTYTEGTVDYVTIQSGEAYLSINGNLYSAENIYSVVGDDYIASEKVPTVTEAALSYDLSDPQDLTVEISLGEDDYEASMVAVFINGETISSDYLSYNEDDGTLTISKDALSDLDAGTYKIAFMFNDTLTTTYTDKVTVTVTGIRSDDE